MLLGLVLGMIVAGAAPGPTVAVQDVGDKIAITLAAPGAESVTETSVPPLWPDEAVIAKTTAGGEVFVGGAVDPAAASVEITFEGDQVIRVPTVASVAYAGRARFFVGQVTSRDIDDDPTTIRVLDDSGAVIGVAKSPDTERSVPLLRRGRIRFRATVTSRLDAVALAPEHRTDQLCLSVALAAGDGYSEAACRNRPEVVSLGGMIGCGRIPTTLVGFVPDGTRRLDVVLGSGRRVHVVPRRAPLGQPGLIVTAVLPRGEGIRRAGALALRVAPPARRCHGSATQWVGYGDEPAPRLGRPPGTQLAAALAGNGGPQLLTRDDGEQLCVGIDRLDDCSLPPLSARSAVLTVDDGYAAGVYPAQVAEVEVRFGGGERLRAPALPGAEYTGRYRDAVHFALIPLLAGRTVSGARLLDAAGRELGVALVVGPDLRPVGRAVLRDGPVRLVAGSGCLGIGRRCREDLADARVVAQVACRPRRTIVFGVARHAEIVLAGGRRVRPRRAGGRYLAVFGPEVAVTGVRIAGRIVGLPGVRPSRQCGWEALA
jgi:hypothetical protein